MLYYVILIYTNDRYSESAWKKNKNEGKIDLLYQRQLIISVEPSRHSTWGPSDILEAPSDFPMAPSDPSDLLMDPSDFPKAASDLHEAQNDFPMIQSRFHEVPVILQVTPLVV